MMMMMYKQQSNLRDQVVPWSCIGAFKIPCYPYTFTSGVDLDSQYRWDTIFLSNN